MSESQQKKKLKGIQTLDNPYVQDVWKSKGDW